MRLAALEEVLAARAAKRPVAVVTALGSAEQRLVYPEAPALDPPFGPDVLEAVRRALRDDRSATVETPSGPVFVHVFNPPLRLVIVGAVHIAQSLAPMAALLGYEVTVVDPRRAFASSARFPDIRIDHDWPDEALERLAPDARTALVTLTHDPKLDDPALAVGLDSAAFYLGALGSRRTHAARVQRLGGRGYDAAMLARIRGPIGLDIGARTPAEIAAAIAAQMTAVLRGAEGA